MERGTGDERCTVAPAGYEEERREVYEVLVYFVWFFMVYEGGGA